MPLKEWIGKLYKAALKDAFDSEPGLVDEFETLKNLYELTKENKPLERLRLRFLPTRGEVQTS